MTSPYDLHSGPRSECQHERLDPEPVLYGPEQLTIRLFDALDRKLAYALADEIDQGIAYYGYKRIDLQIDSPGGEAKALSYLLDRFAGWKREGTTIGTLALGRVASAAAVVVSSGTRGYRRARPHAELLYHNPKASFNPTEACTADALETAQFELGRTQRQVLDALANASRPATEGEAAWRRRLASLLQAERWLTPFEVVELDLIDYIEHSRMRG